MMIRGMVYCMASQVFGGATNATIASSSRITLSPVSSSQSASASDSAAALSVSNPSEPDAEESCPLFAAETAKHHAATDAIAHAAATAPRVKMDPELNSSVMAATQTPDNVADAMKLVRQSCPRRHNAVQHPANARKGRIAEQLLNNVITDAFSLGALYCSYAKLQTNGHLLSPKIRVAGL
jgi:hypothetical protein